MATLTELQAQLAQAEQEFAQAEPGSLAMFKASQRVAHARLALRAAQTGQRPDTLW